MSPTQGGISRHPADTRLRPVHWSCGCDFYDAPLGNKHRHYEKQVDTVKDCPDCKVTAVYVSWRKIEE